MTTTYKPVGVLYCIEHAGVANEDDAAKEFACDWVDQDEVGNPCSLVQCYIQERKKS